MSCAYPGLSSRAKNALRCAGYKTHEEFTAAFVSGVKFDKLPNVGKSTAKEILEWAYANCETNPNTVIDNQIAVLQQLIDELKRKRQIL